MGLKATSRFREMACTGSGSTGKNHPANLSLSSLLAYRFLLPAIHKRGFGASSHFPPPLTNSRGQQLTQALNEA